MSDSIITTALEASDFAPMELDENAVALWDAFYAHPGTAYEAMDNHATFFSGWRNPVIGIEDKGDEIVTHLHILVDSRTVSDRYTEPHQRYREITNVTVPLPEGDDWDIDEFYKMAIGEVLYLNRLPAQEAAKQEGA